jgi:hypothetical protein
MDPNHWGFLGAFGAFGGGVATSSNEAPASCEVKWLTWARRCNGSVAHEGVENAMTEKLIAAGRITKSRMILLHCFCWTNDGDEISKCILNSF